MSNDVTHYLIGVAEQAGIYLLLLAPVVMAGLLMPSARPRRLLPLLLFAALLTLDVAVLELSRVLHLVPGWGGWNWQGKLLESTWPLILVALLPMLTAANTGLTFETARGSWTVMLIVCLVYVALNLPLQLALGAHFSLHVKMPTLLFQASMPGLGEELAYRGVLLALLNKVFGRPWRLWGAQYGFGLVVISVMFGLLHGLDIRGFRVRHVFWPEMTYAFLVGLTLTWLRERTGSVWPGVVFHNLANVMNFLFV